MDLSFFNKWAVYFMTKLIQDFKISTLDAAAIVGNAGHESGGFKSLQEKKPLVPGSKGGYGIMQWTGPRRRDYEAYAKRNGLSVSDMETNYKFLFVELKGPEGKVLARLKNGKTLNEKTKIFSDVFLRPGIPHMNSRYIWAGRALSAFEASKKAGTLPDVKPSPQAPVSSGKGFWAWLSGLIAKIVKGGR